MHVLNKYDKEQLVIELHSQGKTIREIVSTAHLSFSDIGTIIRKIDGRDNDDGVEVKKISKTSPKIHKLCFYFQLEKNLLTLRLN